MEDLILVFKGVFNRRFDFEQKR